VRAVHRPAKLTPEDLTSTVVRARKTVRANHDDTQNLRQNIPCTCAGTEAGTEESRATEERLQFVVSRHLKYFRSGHSLAHSRSQIQNILHLTAHSLKYFRSKIKIFFDFVG
jgi:hypothetical protein